MNPKDGGPEAGRRSVAVIYFSGAGGTALVARLLADLLRDGCEVAEASVADPSASSLAAESDFLVLCYPTYYLRPAPSFADFVASLGPLAPRRPAYLVTTYELYSENSLRACALALRERGIDAVGWKAIRAPGTDVTCVVPHWLSPWLYRFERAFPRKLLSIAAEIRSLAGKGTARASLPQPKWYTPFAQALQILALNRFDLLKYRFIVLRDRCTLCGACASACGRGALRISGGALVHDPGRCEFCCGCIHRCPRRAIVLLRALRDGARLDAARYEALRAEAELALRALTEGARAEAEK
jgi:ferredoxin